MVRRPRRFASSRTSGDIPWAEKTTTAPSGTLVGLVHEDRAARLELTDHVGVVDDLLTHVDRGTVAFEGRLDGLNRPVNPRTVTAGLGEQYASGSRGHVPYGS